MKLINKNKVVIYSCPHPTEKDYSVITLKGPISGYYLLFKAKDFSLLKPDILLIQQLSEEWDKNIVCEFETWECTRNIPNGWEELQKKYNCTEEKAKEMAEYQNQSNVPIGVEGYGKDYKTSVEPVILNDSWLDNLKGIKDG